jgi:RNA polymerase sigma-70 factor (ECF subfamily)
MVFRTLAHLTGERDGLEDMAQEVFLRLFRALPHFHGRAQLTTYIYRIVVNVVNDEFRRRQDARRTTPIDGDSRQFVNPAPGPGELLERRQFQAAVDAALAQLSLRDRTILALQYQEERSYEEIAAVLDLPLGTVKTHLFRARERLKKSMMEAKPRCQKIPC